MALLFAWVLQPLARWEEEDWGEGKQDASGIHLRRVKFLVELPSSQPDVLWPSLR